MASYNGGVSYKGNRDLARSALPEALKLANVVRSLKTATALDSLEKVFTIPGGTVRVVDTPYVHHLYIDVSGEDVSLEAEEAFEELSESTYAIFPVYNDPWPSSAPSGDAVAANIVSDGGLALLPQTFLRNVYNYFSAFSTRLNWGEYDWISQNGLRLYSPLGTVGNKYSMSWGDQPISIYHRQRQVLSAGLYKVLLGYGIMGNKLICLRTQGMTFDDEANPILAYKYDVELFSYDITWNSGTGILSLSNYYLIDTFQQDRTDYGLAADAGFEIPGYQTSQAPFWYDETFNPERAYHPQAGSLWFNFSPDGTKAIRCRYFPTQVGSTVTNTTFKEELAFSLDMFGNVAYTRTKTADAAGPVFTLNQITNTNSDISTLVSTPSGRYPPASLPVLEFTEVVFNRDSSASITETYSLGSEPLVLAYDYDNDGDLVTAHITFAGGAGSYSYIASYSEEWTGTPTYDTPGVWEEFTLDKSGSGSLSYVYSDTLADFESTLHISKGGVTYDIPYFFATHDKSDSRIGSWTYTGTEVWVAGFPAGSVQQSDVETRTGTTPRTMAGATTGNFAMCMPTSGTMVLDLRNGFVVTSFAEHDESWSVSYSNSDVNDALAQDSASGTRTTSGSREDTLYILEGLTATVVPLPEITNVTAPADYTFTKTEASTSSSGSRVYDFRNSVDSDSATYLYGASGRILQALGGAMGFAEYNSASNYAGTPFPLKSSLWAFGLLRGPGSAIGVDLETPIPKAMFSVLSTDFDYGADWGEVFDGDGGKQIYERRFDLPCQVNRFPLCQQALFYYDVSGLLLELTSSMWPAIEFDITTGTYREKDNGITSFSDEYSNLGLVKVVEFVKADEAP